MNSDDALLDLIASYAVYDMSTQELLKIVAERGLRLELRDGNRPVIMKKDGSTAVTDALLAVLKRHRDRIVQMLKKTEVK